MTPLACGSRAQPPYQESRDSRQMVSLGNTWKLLLFRLSSIMVRAAHGNSPARHGSCNKGKSRAACPLPAGEGTERRASRTQPMGSASFLLLASPPGRGRARREAVCG